VRILVAGNGVELRRANLFANAPEDIKLPRKAESSLKVVVLDRNYLVVRSTLGGNVAESISTGTHAGVDLGQSVSPCDIDVGTSLCNAGDCGLQVNVDVVARRTSFSNSWS
jgi:hypothetical protein